jgi:hypothetical protein
MNSTIVTTANTTDLYSQAYEAICAWAHEQGIYVQERRLPPGTAGCFDGVSAMMNSDYEIGERLFYLVHAFGSIVCWSRGQEMQEMFDGLRLAKENRQQDPEMLERMIVRYCELEIRSSEYAVWLLNELGFASVVPAYTNFMRADVQSMTQFHRNGIAPVWKTFFEQWNREVENGSRVVQPFEPRRIVDFRPRRIRMQEILQEQPKSA